MSTAAVPTPARPLCSPEDASVILAQHWNLSGQMRELGSQQDRNFRADAEHGPVVLKIAHGATTRGELDAQHAALQHLATTGLRVPAPVATTTGDEVVRVRVGDEELLARVLTFVSGESLLDRAGFGPAEAREIGTAAGRVARALEEFTHPGTARVSQWDIRRAGEVVTALAPSVVSRGRREDVLRVSAAALARIAPLRSALPTQVIHADLSDDNIVRDDQDGFGIIDFGDLMLSWRIGELVAPAAAAYMRDDADALFFAMLEAFGEQVTLTDDEIDALWSLVVLRAAVLGVSGDHQIALDGDNDYAQARSAAEWRSFAAASTRDPEEMNTLIRASVRGTARLPQTFSPMIAVPLNPIDLSVTSAALSAGSWLEPDAEERMLRAAGTAAPAATRYGEYRLTRTLPYAPRGHAATLALAVEFAAASDLTVTAPVAGVVRDTETGFALDTEALTLWVDGVHGVSAGPVAAGDALGALTAGTLGAVQIGPPAAPRPPRCVTPGQSERWRAVCPDPSALLGTDLTAPEPRPEETLHRREAVFAAAQEHYYAQPPQIERGWREFLIDVHGQSYVDVVNNVTLAGHAHSGIVEAAARQWALLNTNSRFHYAAVAEFSERLAALAPAGLDRVFLVNSGSEAVDLALRLAMTATGRPRILAAREAYHGWTLASDAVSTSIGDNPRALHTRPDWVQLLDAPNPVRGTHRGPDAAAGYLADLDTLLEGLGSAGREALAGVILEPIFGNGGGVLLPDGYLAGVFDRVRALGGVCISDEVQVGYGRLGAHFWGFEQQGAVPDILTVAKAMGNGQPLGAVITTREIAEAFEQEGSFFSSAGGSPVSARVGIAVLDALRDEDLQGNALRVGAHFAAALGELAHRHPAIGAVHGMGLYLGVELVSDTHLTPDPGLATRVCERMLSEGCVVQPTGDHKNVLKIKPPLCIDATSVDYVVRALDRALTAE